MLINVKIPTIVDNFTSISMIYNIWEFESKKYFIFQHLIFYEHLSRITCSLELSIKKYHNLEVGEDVVRVVTDITIMTHMTFWWVCQLLPCTSGDMCTGNPTNPLGSTPYPNSYQSLVIHHQWGYVYWKPNPSLRLDHPTPTHTNPSSYTTNGDMCTGNPTNPLGSITLPQPIPIPRHTPPMGICVLETQPHPLGSTTLPQPIPIPRHTPPMGICLLETQPIP